MLRQCISNVIFHCDFTRQIGDETQLPLPNKTNVIHSDELELHWSVSQAITCSVRLNGAEPIRRKSDFWQIGFVPDSLYGKSKNSERAKLRETNHCAH